MKDISSYVSTIYLRYTVLDDDFFLRNNPDTDISFTFCDEGVRVSGNEEYAYLKIVLLRMLEESRNQSEAFK